MHNWRSFGTIYVVWVRDLSALHPQETRTSFWFLKTCNRDRTPIHPTGDRAHPSHLEQFCS
ncbi:MAG: hypothetical protein AB4290_14110 [Spirulina sp.]